MYVKISVDVTPCSLDCTSRFFSFVESFRSRRKSSSAAVLEVVVVALPKYVFKKGIGRFLSWQC